MDSGSILLADFCLNLKGQTVFSLKLLQDSDSLRRVGQFYPLGGCAMFVALWSGALRGFHAAGNLISLVPTALAALPAGVTSGPGEGMDDCVQRNGEALAGVFILGLLLRYLGRIRAAPVLCSCLSTQQAIPWLPEWGPPA